MKIRTLILSLVAVSLAGASASARGRRGKHFKKWRDRVRKEVRREVDRRRRDNDKPTVADMKVGSSEKPVEWLTDFDAAAKTAGEKDKPLMLLFTTRQLEDSSRSCTFAANRLRRRVRESKILSVKILPPELGDTKGLPKEEAAKRKELHEKAKKRYVELVKQFGITKGPSLIFCASDAKRLSALLVPSDDQIAGDFDKLGGLIEKHNQALGKKPPAGKDAPKPVAKPDPGKVEVKPAPKPEKKGPVDPDEDF